MNKRALIVLAVAALLTLSGCAGMFGGEDTTPTPEQTPPSTSVPQNASDTYPPNVSEDGSITDDEAFLQNHRTELSNADSFTLDGQQSIMHGDNVTRNKTVSFNVAGDQRYYEEIGRDVYTANSSASVFIRAEQRGDIRYRYGSEYDASLGRAAQLSVLRPILYAGNFTAEGVTEENGETLTQFRLTDIEDASILDATFAVNPNSTEAQVMLHVTPDGLIKSYDITLSDDTRTLSYSGEFTSLNATTIETPDWVAAAEDSARAVDVSIVNSTSGDHGEYFTLTHKTGLDFNRGTTFLINSPSESVQTTLNQSVSRGDTVYLYVPTNSSTLVVSETEPAPEDTRNLTSEQYQFGAASSDLSEIYVTESVTNPVATEASD